MKINTEVFQIPTQIKNKLCRSVEKEWSNNIGKQEIIGQIQEFKISNGKEALELDRAFVLAPNMAIWGRMYT